MNKKNHSEFRKYLSIEEGKDGPVLINLINAAENNLPALIKQYIRPDFDCLYNNLCSLDELLMMSARIKSNYELLTQHFNGFGIIYPFLC